jgi:hypothetical protein
MGMSFLCVGEILELEWRFGWIVVKGYEVNVAVEGEGGISSATRGCVRMGFSPILPCEAAKSAAGCNRA